MRPFILVIALAAACGTTARSAGSSSVGPPVIDAGTPTSGSDAGSSASNGTDAGATTGADAGTSTGGDDAGTPDAGIPNGGSDGGSGSGGSGPDGGTGAGGGSADGGTVASDCDGLRFPADPGPAPANHFIRFWAPSSPNNGCFAVGTTGTGTLALEMLAQQSTLDFLSPSGSLLASSTVPGSKDFFGEEADFFDDMQMSGTYVVRKFTDTGAEQPAERRDISLLGEDPTGGAVGVSTSPCSIVSIDSSLTTRWTAPCPNSGQVALVVDRSGATLYVFEDPALGANSIFAMWIDAHGNAGQPFVVTGLQPQSIGTLAIAQRVGSGFFLRVGADWISQIDSLSTTWSPPPPWLQARPNTTLHMVHGGMGYAVLPDPSMACAQDVEVIGRAGTSCGITRFTAAASACSIQSAVIVGYDGTVIQRAPDPDPTHQSSSGPETCYWHWWPGFFK